MRRTSGKGAVSYLDSNSCSLKGFTVKESFKTGTLKDWDIYSCHFRPMNLQEHCCHHCHLSSLIGAWLRLLGAGAIAHGRQLSNACAIHPQSNHWIQDDFLFISFQLIV